MTVKPAIYSLLSIGIIGLFVLGATALASAGGPNVASDGQDRFIGAWHLVSLEEEGADGKVHLADCTGMLVFTTDGHMSVQVMYQNQKQGAASGSVQYAQSGYEASFGKYAINDPHTFTYRVEGALVRSLIGKDLSRTYAFSCNQLIIQSSNPNERWRVVWQHD
jgi:hypothetical protein